ncbi:uncharacterized protein BXZ73DRAFT_102267 [Epithele typhae]|uniref:uncharacterized protein n=1 Tax=Epithele typhae TaxID=378194 RepID=UPI00200771CF|nr:uncharacterized protein BXZ73DRAFT_102267 [Epithele typhae]KAH9929116.1 hypothetical protein BXZ73DRAFT_102267 [Epithele typhae]
MSALKEIAEAGGDQLADLKLVKYAIVVAATWTWAEICVKMEEEITYIWPSRISFMKVLYLYNRYSPVVDTTLALASSLSNVGNHRLCTTEFQVLAFSYATGSFASELILIARTLALYNFQPYVIALMCALVVLTVVPTAVTSIKFLFPLPYPGDDIIKITGCMPSVDDIDSGWVIYTCLLISETGKRHLHCDPLIAMLTSLLPAVIVLLTFFRQWQTAIDREGPFRRLFRWGGPSTQTDSTMSVPRSHRSPLVKTMYRNTRPPLVVQMPLRAVHASLCTRVLLNLRQVATQGTSRTMPTLQSRPSATSRSAIQTRRGAHVLGLEEQLHAASGWGDNTRVELELGLSQAIGA